MPRRPDSSAPRGKKAALLIGYDGPTGGYSRAGTSRVNPNGASSHMSRPNGVVPNEEIRSGVGESCPQDRGPPDSPHISGASASGPLVHPPTGSQSPRHPSLASPRHPPLASPQESADSHLTPPTESSRPCPVARRGQGRGVEPAQNPDQRVLIMLDAGGEFENRVKRTISALQKKNHMSFAGTYADWPVEDKKRLWEDFTVWIWFLFKFRYFIIY